MKLTVPLIAVLLLMATPAWAACPAPSPGTSAEEIRANEQRLLCLQQELARETSRRKLEMDLDALNRRFDALQLQQKLDGLPKFEPPQIVLPPPMPMGGAVVI